MPFQFIALGMRAHTGSPTSKLIWLYLLQECDLLDAPNGKASLQLELYDLSAFAQVTDQEALAALHELRRLQLVEGIEVGGIPPTSDPNTLYMEIHVPMSPLQRGERKRIKATPDQIHVLEAKANYRCAGCGISSLRYQVSWEVDHIIPQSIGGADVEENCQLLCQKCNGRKGAKIHWVDFLGGRGG